MAEAGSGLTGRTLHGPGLAGPGFGVVEAAARAIDRYRMMSDAVAGRPIVVAVSGGPDSMCLLDVLTRLRSTFGLAPFVVAHVDHGLSPSSAEVAARVAAWVAAQGFELHTVTAPDLSGPNLHARARAFRYSFFETVAEKVGAGRIATGHTLDDRVETTLARLIHGAGTDALAGLRPLDGKRMRPLIGVRRAETRAYCIERSLEFEEDPANDDARFERAVIRNELLSVVERRWGPGAVRAIAASAERLAEDASLLAGLTDASYPQVARVSDRETRLDADRFAELPRSLRRRILERAVGRVRDRAGAIEDFLDAFERGLARGATFSVAGGAEIAVDADAIVVRRRPEANAE